ncbi:DUF1643 domain-containing protein [Planctomicrobium sp. SH668]|uniref:DUF1643 domain-containing protein n=1 Tax=Planctomicrobium sp. SH668 TaxID=3448126 RepID=UPI003F5B9402
MFYIATHEEDDVYSEAVYSPCRQFRYSLVRRFGKPLAKKSDRISFIGLNPSTATERVNDPTVRRCIGYARDWGYREFVMLNAFGYRSTDPAGLKAIEDPVGAPNLDTIVEWVNKSDVVVCCWGVHAVLNNHNQRLLALLSPLKTRATCFGKTQAGHPKHPLYLRKDAPLVDLWK